jgi:hypothetical protein
MSCPYFTSRMPASRRLSMAAAMALVLGIGGTMPLTARADDPPAQPSAPAADAAPAAGAAAPAQPAPAPATNHVDGFRSAHFDMNQAEVRKAITTDFGVKPGAIKASTNEIQKTGVLEVSVPGDSPNALIAGGGTAVVQYYFGYKSKKLIQIRVAWAGEGDANAPKEQLMTNGQQLQTYFASAGYQVLGANMVKQDGLVLFQGRDADGHLTLLQLHGNLTAGKTKQQANLNLTGPLTIDYIANPQKLDIFELPAGKF